jgi:hypothetical protein
MAKIMLKSIGLSRILKSFIFIFCPDSHLFKIGISSVDLSANLNPSHPKSRTPNVDPIGNKSQIMLVIRSLEAFINGMYKNPEISVESVRSINLFFIIDTPYCTLTLGYFNITIKHNSAASLRVALSGF